MRYRLTKWLNRSWFDWRTSGIFQTPPVVCDASSHVVVVSQLYHPDMTMYLLAAKSFARFLAPKEFVIVDDGLTANDRDVLRTHLSQVRFVMSRDVDTGPCPRGGCWERLMTLSRENESSYSIQLDSDTLTLADPSLVRECAIAGRTFTMGTSSGQQTVPLDVAGDYAKTMPASNHVQYVAERALADFPNAAGLRYVRGCAGFTGFARHDLRRERIEFFSTELEKLLGRASWARWGSEQVASNLLAANAEGCVVLPIDAYPFWAPGIAVNQARLIHFFGTYRYSGGLYAARGREVIRELNGSKHTRA